MSLEIANRRVNSATVLDLSGRLTLGAGSNQLRETIQKLVGEGHKHILLNLAEVAFLDSAGLGSLVVCSNLLRAQGGVLRIVNAPEQVSHVLQITRLDRVLPAFPDEHAALESFPA